MLFTLKTGVGGQISIILSGVILSKDLKYAAISAQFSMSILLTPVLF